MTLQYHPRSNLNANPGNYGKYERHLFANKEGLPRMFNKMSRKARWGAFFLIIPSLINAFLFLIISGMDIFEIFYDLDSAFIPMVILASLIFFYGCFHLFLSYRRQFNLFGVNVFRKFSQFGLLIVLMWELVGMAQVLLYAGYFEEVLTQLISSLLIIVGLNKKRKADKWMDNWLKPLGGQTLFRFIKHLPARQPNFWQNPTAISNTSPKASPSAIKSLSADELQARANAINLRFQF